MFTQKKLDEEQKLRLLEGQQQALEEEHLAVEASLKVRAALGTMTRSAEV
jgi:hypothetical protein